jgi:hypothetical protein
MKIFMIKCNKCSIEKLDNEYYTYYHSSQQKWRTRKICNSCMNEGKRLYKETIKTKKIMEPVVLELEIEVVNPLSTNPDYRLCRTCQEYVHLDGFYKYKARGITFKEYLDCRKCCNKKESDKRKEERQEWKENTGGSDRISNDVGVFQDTYQKEQCYMVMEVLGYTYSEECGHFLKPGVKEYVDGKLKFYKVNKLKFPNGQKIDYNTPEWKEIYELYTSGKNSQKQISRKYGVSTATISKYINRMKNEE